MKEAWNNGNKEGLLIHRGIDIYNKQNQLIRQLREDLLRPRSSKFICDVENDTFFRVRLSTAPKETLDRQLPIDDNRSLIMYPRYQRGSGDFVHRPHRYPMTAKKNLNLFLKVRAFPFPFYWQKRF